MRVLLLPLFALLCSVAHARTLAVLPLEQGVGSEVYAGLGTALAGMLITDLSQVEGVAVVERAQLDALLAEIKLGESGYVDPATAAKLGEGVGAEWIVLGSWSVIPPQFLLDIRVVEVKTGVVLGSTAVSGTVDDFVSVEKDAVESLLTALKVDVSGSTRRRILAEAPTESFEAMQAYAAGLQAEQQQNYDAARAFYDRSTKADPNFTAPSLRASALSAQIKRAQEDSRTQRRLAEQALLERGIARSPDELSLTRPGDAEELARLRVRWALLAHLGKPCQVAQEMRHALERHHGRLPKDDDAWARLHFAAYDLKLYDERPTRSPNGVLMPDGDVAEILFRAPGASPTSLIIDITNGVDDANRLGRGLANLTLACAGYGEQDRIDALVELRQAIERLGLAKVRAQADGTTIGEELEVLELDARVRVEGMSARIAARIEKLLAGQDGHSSLQSDARMVIGNAEYVESHRLLKQDLDYATVYAWLHAGPDGGDLLDLSTPACAPLKTVTWNTKRFDGVMEDGAIVLKEYSHTVNALIDAHALRRVGCVKGVKGDLTTAAQALAWMDTFPNRFIATADVAKCTEDHQELVKSMRHTRTPRPDAPEAWAFTIVQAGVRRMVSTGCAQR